MKLSEKIIFYRKRAGMNQEALADRLNVSRQAVSKWETGEAVQDLETGLCVTRARLGNVTFWVKYTETETGYLVHRAYSHRMKVSNRE